VTCLGDAMAGWLVRAIVMENVSARHAGAVLELPAAPHFRLDREIKNVITVAAKTCHYWMGHVPRDQQRDIGELFLAMAREAPLLEPDCADPPAAGGGELARAAAAAIQRQTGLRRAPRHYNGWLGLECPDVGSAIVMMRALVASNVLARREETTLFVPVNPRLDADGTRLARAVADVHRLSSGRRSV
jgi:hypothetical protein